MVENKEISGAGAVIKLLEEYGVTYIFGYPGGANLPLYDALYHSKKITHILSKHEQGAIFMASGYARISGKPGVCFATSGPGVTNIITGLADSYLDSVPIIAITGQIPQDFIGTDAFQEVDTFNITSPITKNNELINDHEELLPALHSAFYICNSGRPGPVLIDIPRDIQEKKNTFTVSQTRPLPGYKPTIRPHIGQIKRTIRAIQRSKKPLIIIGGGVERSNCQNLLVRFIERSGIPAVRTLMGKGVINEEHPYFIGMIGTHGNSEANRIVTQSDLIIAIGTRLGDRSTMFKKQYFTHDAVVIHIDIDPAEIGKTIAVDIPVVGDINETIPMLLKGYENNKIGSRKNWFKKKNNNNILWKGDSGEVIGLVLKELSKIDKPFHITTDVGRHQMWATHYCNNPKHLPILTSGGLGTMGYGLPAAIGCWFADPTIPVVNISGDGSFFMNMQEFITAVENDVQLTILIINDQKLGMIKEIQDMRYGKRSFENEFKQKYNFIELAKSLGGEGYLINDRYKIKSVLNEAIFSKKPTIIDFDLYQVAREQNQVKLKAI